MKLGESAQKTFARILVAVFKPEKSIRGSLKKKKKKIVIPLEGSKALLMAIDTKAHKTMKEMRK